MSRHQYDTKPPFQLLNSDDPWTVDVVPQLPADLEQQAHLHGALIRKRAFGNATLLLRGLLAYAVVCSSLRHLGAWAVLTDVADVSAPAWHKRLRAAGPFLLWLLGELLRCATTPMWLAQRVRHVRFVDATTLKQSGGSGDDWRVHSAYDFLAGRISDVILTDRRGAESLNHFSLRPGEIVVADGGYARRESVATARESGADLLVRIYPTTFPLQDSSGNSFDVVGWLRTRGSPRRSRLAYCIHDGKRYAVRVLAQRLDEAKWRAAQHRVRRRAHQRYREPSEQALFLAGWVVLVTTLTDTMTWSDDELWQLYAARWQIERLFKRIKQLVHLATLRVTTVSSAEAFIRAVLVAWVLHEGEIGELKRLLQAAAQPAPATLPGQLPLQEAVVSSWMVSTLVMETLREAIRGRWTRTRLRACLPRLQRYIVSHPRSRLHQETAVWAWLIGLHLTPRRHLPDPLP